MGGKGKRLLRRRADICGLFAGRWRQGSGGRQIEIQFSGYPSARDLEETAPIVRSHSPGGALESSLGEGDGMVVVTGKARFGGGEEQEP